jgi:RNA polymerase sigma factor (sigma-70 family)
VATHAQFEQLYRRQAGRVLAYALRRTSPAVADDVVAEVFLVAWRRLDDMPADEVAWLLGVARRVLANRRRGDRRATALHDRLAFEHRDLTSDASAASAASAAGDAGDGDTRGAGGVDERVLTALGRLAERDRELLMLIAWEDLSHAEVAQVLGVRRGTVAVRLHRARQQLAAALAEQDAAAETTTEVSR